VSRIRAEAKKKNEKHLLDICIVASERFVFNLASSASLICVQHAYIDLSS
jgi:hypothetical protein